MKDMLRRLKRPAIAALLFCTLISVSASNASAGGYCSPYSRGYGYGGYGGYRQPYYGSAYRGYGGYGGYGGNGGFAGYGGNSGYAYRSYGGYPSYGYGHNHYHTPYRGW